MTAFNGITVINRQNRPTPIVPTKLDFFMVQGGSYTDPYAVCSVHVFRDTQFGSPDQYLDLTAGSETYGLVSSTGLEKMVFRVQTVDSETGQRNGFTGAPAAFPAEAAYSDAQSASGIFRTDAGKFSVILQTGTKFYPLSATDIVSLPTIENSASSVGGYIDIWTVVDAEGSDPQIYVNTFKLSTANTYAVTESVAVTTTNKLIDRYVEVGSIKKLRIKTDLVVDNEPIKESLRNLIETGALLQSPEISITKINETPGLTARVQITGTGSVGGFQSENVEIDSHGTISYLWDTSNIEPFYNDENLGGSTGVYEVQVKYTVLDQTIYSPRFKLIVR